MEARTIHKTQDDLSTWHNRIEKEHKIDSKLWWSYEMASHGRKRLLAGHIIVMMMMMMMIEVAKEVEGLVSLIVDDSVHEIYLKLQRFFYYC